MTKTKALKLFGLLVAIALIALLMNEILDPFGDPIILMENQTQQTLSVDMSINSDVIAKRRHSKGLSRMTFEGVVEPGQQIKLTVDKNADYWIIYADNYGNGEEEEIIFSQKYSSLSEFEKTGWKTYKGIITP